MAMFVKQNFWVCKTQFSMVNSFFEVNWSKLYPTLPQMIGEFLLNVDMGSEVILVVKIEFMYPLGCHCLK